MELKNASGGRDFESSRLSSTTTDEGPRDRLSTAVQAGEDQHVLREKSDTQTKETSLGPSASLLRPELRWKV